MEASVKLDTATGLANQSQAALGNLYATIANA
jgi:hypothetical protein